MEWWEAEFAKLYISMPEKTELLKRIARIEQAVESLDSSINYIMRNIAMLCKTMDANSNAIDMIWLEQGNPIVETDDEEDDDDGDDTKKYEGYK